MESSRNRRSWKNFLINQKIQLRVTLINLVFMGIAVLLNTAVMLSSSLCNIYYTGESIWMQTLDMYILSSDLLVVSLALAFVLAIISQIVLTHQFCGPLVNFTNSFKKISQGDLTRKVHLRPRDLLKPEADEFNEMVAKLTGYIETLKLDNQTLLLTLKDLAAAPDGPGKVEKARNLIREQEQMIQNHIDRLKLATESSLAN